MNSMLLRTLQIGIGLIVVTAVTLFALYILGMLAAESAVQIALNVSGVIVVVMLGSLILGGLFAIRTGEKTPRDKEPSTAPGQDR